MGAGVSGGGGEHEGRVQGGDTVPERDRAVLMNFASLVRRKELWPAGAQVPQAPASATHDANPAPRGPHSTRVQRPEPGSHGKGRRSGRYRSGSMGCQSTPRVKGRSAWRVRTAARLSTSMKRTAPESSATKTCEWSE